MSILRYTVLHERASARFPWIVVDTADGEPALWQNDAKVGKVPLRFRTQELAQAAADQLNAEAKAKRQTRATRR